ncbi:MAG TPA: esterase-like activity of phytase family protein [Planctomycetaceae bacterium]|nr:esterase-like activity of phytase family protein [Planctomycetaceae bacterium]
MSTQWTKQLLAATCLLAVGGLARAARAEDEIQFLGMAELPPGTTDKSGLTDLLLGKTPHNQLGGLSALEYSGHDDVYYVLPDRGPGDGSAPYLCRWQLIELKPPSASGGKASARVVGTTMLTAIDGKPLIGLSTAFDPNGPHGNHRFDPEGLRLGPRGSIFISDEYGPYIYEFDSTGHQIRALGVPARYSIAHPGATKEEEVENNTSGRVSNAGFESLAITPDGKRLYALIQAPLLQDSQRTKKGKVKGINCRLLEIDLASGKTRELLYPLDNEKVKTSEMLAIDNHRFLVIERDNQAGQNAEFKKIMEIDIAGASDISAIDSLPPKKLPKGVKPVRKSVSIDLLDSRYGLAGPHLAEKQEGLAWGPLLPDGRKLLWICVDNDFKPGAPCQFYAFAIRPGDAQANR